MDVYTTGQDRPPAEPFRIMIGSATASPPAVMNVRFGYVLLALIALTAVRIWGLYVSTVDLYVDEAQYWAWSRDLAFGYFSKPPLLAWIIAASDQLCGSAEACVRGAFGCLSTSSAVPCS